MDADTLIMKCVERRADFLRRCVVDDAPLEFIHCLVQLSADVNEAGANGTTALLVASQEGRLEIVKCLVGEYGADVGQAGYSGAFPLMMAAKNRHLGVLRYLVEHGADVNQATCIGHTCLFAACYAGYLDVVQCLLEDLGADVNQATKAGHTPAHTAAIFGHTDVLRCLVKSGAKGLETLLFGVIEGMTFPRFYVEELFNGGELSSFCNEYTRCTSGELQRKPGDSTSDMVRCLIQISADVNQASERGDTALRVAAKRGKFDILRLLVEFGANVDQRGGFFLRNGLARGWLGNKFGHNAMPTRAWCVDRTQKFASMHLWMYRAACTCSMWSLCDYAVPA
jgi:ankyrin repeat protein